MDEKKLFMSSLDLDYRIEITSSESVEAATDKTQSFVVVVLIVVVVVFQRSLS